MTLLWTESSNLVDKLIKLMTGEDCGHFAILFESQEGTGVVFESNLLGTHPAFYQTWVTGRQIIHSMKVPMSAQDEDALWDLWVTNFDGKPYDYMGALYVGLCKLRKRIFGTALPTNNAWAKESSYYCDEIYQLISGLPGCPTIVASSNGMDTPHDVWLAVSGGAVGSV